MEKKVTRRTPKMIKNDQKMTKFFEIFKIKCLLGLSRWFQIRECGTLNLGSDWMSICEQMRFDISNGQCASMNVFIKICSPRFLFESSPSVFLRKLSLLKFFILIWSCFFQECPDLKDNITSFRSFRDIFLFPPTTLVFYGWKQWVYSSGTISFENSSRSLFTL